MKTKTAAIRQYRKLHGNRDAFVVYQFPRGHWNYATPASPIGLDLATNGYIYPQLNCKAQQWQLIQPA